MHEPHKERRRFKRIQIKQKMNCQFISNPIISDMYTVYSHNIAQAGMLIETDVPMPLGSLISIEIDQAILQNIVVERILSHAEIDESGTHVASVCGKIVRVENVGDHKFCVAVHLIN